MAEYHPLDSGFLDSMANAGVNRLTLGIKSALCKDPDFYRNISGIDCFRKRFG